MSRLLRLKPVWALLLYLFVDVFCVGAGMGVPFFCILLGFPAGWVIARRVSDGTRPAREVLRHVLRWAALTSGVTLLGMLPIWGPQVTMLFDPRTDFARLGVPLILYEPMASFIGWLILMIFISPFLQFLMTLFGAQVGLLVHGFDGSDGFARIGKEESK
jgi:hypothetical protein